MKMSLESGLWTYVPKTEPSIHGLKHSATSPLDHLLKDGIVVETKQKQASVYARLSRNDIKGLMYQKRTRGIFRAHAKS